MKNNSLLEKGINISCVNIEDVAYIYLEDRRELLRLDEIGSFIWNKISGLSTVKEIIGFCIKEYEGDEKEITKYVKEFLTCLLKESMVSIKLGV